MTLRIMSVIALMTSLSGCAASPLSQIVLSKMAGSATGAATQPDQTADQKWITLVNRGVKFQVAQLSERDGVTVWAARDGTQVFLRGSMVVGTRGFGRDLMSADVPTTPTLLEGRAHQRTYFDMDGTDTMISHVFTCTTTLKEAKDFVFGSTHVVEKCLGDLGTIENTFLVSAAGSVLKSRQWISQGIGYAAFD